MSSLSVGVGRLAAVTVLGLIFATPAFSQTVQPGVTPGRVTQPGVVVQPQISPPMTYPLYQPWSPYQPYPPMPCLVSRAGYIVPTRAVTNYYPPVVNPAPFVVPPPGLWRPVVYPPQFPAMIAPSNSPTAPPGIIDTRFLPWNTPWYPAYPTYYTPGTVWPTTTAGYPVVGSPGFPPTAPVITTSGTEIYPGPRRWQPWVPQRR